MADCRIYWMDGDASYNNYDRMIAMAIMIIMASYDNSK